jgi:hypothetical protein
MKFRRCSIAGEMYGLPMDENEEPDHKYSQLSEVYIFICIYNVYVYMCRETYGVPMNENEEPDYKYSQ